MAVCAERDKMVAPPAASFESRILVHADEDCIVVPGLIDMHTHIFYRASELGFNPDPGLLPQGVTTTVDAGTCGALTFGAFNTSVISTSNTRIFAELNVCAAGMPTLAYHENGNPDFYDLPRMLDIQAAYPDKIVGVKVRMDGGIWTDMSAKPLEKALEIADAMKLPLICHLKEPPMDAGDIAELLRPGDIFTHVYSPHGNTILDGKGKVKSKVWKARERGVLFDAANSGPNSALSIIQPAFEQGFFPDIISTDMVDVNIYNPGVFGLPYILTYMWAVGGMELGDIIKSATITPARALKLPKVGSLAPGNFADIAVFRIVEKPMTIRDRYNTQLKVNKWLVPQLTALGGRVCWRDMLFRHDNDNGRPEMVTLA